VVSRWRFLAILIPRIRSSEALLKRISFFKTNLGLVLVSSTASALLLAGAFELIENIRYFFWRKRFDNFGWFGKLTVRSANPMLMWEYRPYGQFEQVKTNRYGFRDLDFASTNKPRGIYRFAFIGDSVTLGMRVDIEETFVRQFEAAANQLALQQPVQALNFAVDGYNTPQIHEMLRTKTLAFQPDKVVYMLCMNDFDFEESSGMKIRYFRKPQSFLLLNLERTYYKLSGGEFYYHHFRKNRTIVFKHLLDMSTMLQREHIAFQVVILPVFKPEATDFGNYPLGRMHQEITDFLEKSGIQYLDLLDAFATQERPPKFYAFDTWHLNANGHTFIAQMLLSSALPH